MRPDSRPNQRDSTLYLLFLVLIWMWATDQGRDIRPPEERAPVTVWSTE